MTELLEPHGSVTPESAPMVAEAALSPSTGATPDWRTTARSLGRVGLAVLLYGLLADAALETVLSGSAVRWVTTGTVAAYAVATVLCWRRLGWSAKATTSYLVLLVLFLLTAWQGQGLRDGIHVLGQPTAVVLTGASALAVLFSAGVLIRQAFLPRPARAAIAAAALYSAAAFLSGINAAVEFPNLFHGESLWIRLPFWLQGAFVGSLVLVPGTAVYQVAIGVRLRGAGLRLRGLQIVGLSAAILLAVAALRAPVGLGFGPTETRGHAGVVRLSPVTFAMGESGSQPVGPARRFKQGIKAVYAFVDFEGLTGEDTIDAVWYKGANRLAEQRFTMGELYGASLPHKGYLRFILQLDQGALPGAYFLEISMNGILGQVGILPIDPLR